jgi:RNA polymerase sigma-70 factor (ECF subfamily)
VRLAQRDLELFEAVVLPHLDDAYTLARYLLRDEHDAQDVVQEAVLRALRHFEGYREGNGRAWLLTIVRNCCYSWQRKHRRDRAVVEYTDEEHGLEEREDSGPEAAVMAESDRWSIDQALASLPTEFREVIVLREIQGMSYKEIVAVSGVPVGTVMSRLARARKRMRDLLRLDVMEAG